MIRTHMMKSRRQHRTKAQINGDDNLEMRWCFTWEIKQFDDVKKILLSPKFSWRQDVSIKWQLQLCPNLDGYIGIFLSLMDSSEDIPVTFSVSLIDSNKKAQCTKTIPKHVFGDLRKGFPDFMEVQSLLNKASELLPKDKLTVYCDITTLDENVNRYPPAVPSTLIKECSDLSKLEKFSDVTLSVGEKQFKVHKVILAASSSVFSAMFEHDMHESHCNNVEITDLEADTVERMIQFIYKGEVELINVADTLLVAADKYALEKLKMLCEGYLMRNIDVDNSTDILVLAEMHNAENLKARALDFIKRNINFVVKTARWKSDIVLHPNLVLQLFDALASIHDLNLPYHGSDTE